METHVYTIYCISRLCWHTIYRHESNLRIFPGFRLKAAAAAVALIVKLGFDIIKQKLVGLWADYRLKNGESSTIAVGGSPYFFAQNLLRIETVTPKRSQSPHDYI